MFNEFFLSHNNIDLSNARLPSDTIGNLADDIFIDHINVSEAGVAELISNLNPNKATGPDGISPKILKEAGSTIAPSLTRLIKLSLQTRELAQVIRVGGKAVNHHISGTTYTPLEQTLCAFSMFSIHILSITEVSSLQHMQVHKNDITMQIS